MCSTINRSRGRPYSPSGCPVQVGNTICGETQTLHIINEFKRLYENKMQEIDSSNCGDCLQEKLKLQQDWIGDLTEQNEMLVRAVEELEIEATERVKMLEDKLQRSAENINEVIKKYREYDSTNSILEEPREKIFHLENDLKNLLEFLRRIREEQQWDSGGLVFYDLTENDLFGSKNNEENRSVKQFLNVDTLKGRRKLEQQENIIREMEKKIIEGVCLGKQLEIKKEECENLQKNMIDMRQALTEEVATKHDIILKLKKEVQELEDRCIQADKQTAFRDDIIKELRKEIKQLKQQISLPEKPYPKDSDIIRKDIKENLLIINHTNKKVTSENSALLYIHHDEKPNKNLINKSTATKVDVDTNFTNFTQCRSKFENATENLLIPECKSETDLKSRNPKGRSNLTVPGGLITRRNTFATSTIRDQKNSIPNHSPVKMFVNNLEINNSKKN